MKTRLTAKQLREFAARLRAKRAELAGDVAHLTDEALNRTGPRGYKSSSMPIHMAELGSDNWEREFTLGLIANERAVVREIDDALGRIRDRTYGVCMMGHEPISVARLRAKPWAKYCIACAEQRDAGHMV
ncbi:MAG: TraR/DksA family transcriptional regulator [Phycisphaerae bacterium]